MARKLKRVFRTFTEEEKRRHAEIRAAAYKDFPPKQSARPAPKGLPAAIRAARETQGMTWYALAQRAGIPNQGTIRDIEQGNDVKLSNLRTVANALGLELKLVPVA